MIDAEGSLYVVLHNTLSAFQDRTGQLLWKYANPWLDASPGQTPNAPVISQGMVYVSVMRENDANIAKNGEWVYALSARSGQVIWHTQVSNVTDGGPSAQLHLIDGMIYLSWSAQDNSSPLAALRASDGKLVWTANESTNSGLAVSLLATSPEMVYVLENNNTDIVALSPRDGVQYWDYAYSPSCYIGSASLVDGILYTYAFCQKGGEADAIKAKTGKLLWSYPFTDGLPSSLFAIHNVVFVDVTDHFFALDAQTGYLLWGLDLPQQSVGVSSEIWGANDHEVFVTLHNVWYALSLREGKTIWKYTPTSDGDLSNEIILLQMRSWFISQNRIYLPDFSQVKAFQPDTGKVQWNFSPTKNEHMHSFAFFQGILYVSAFLPVATPQSTGQQAQDIYAIQTDTGKVLWNTIQVSLPGTMTPAGTYFVVVTGKSFHFTYRILALDTSTGKQMWTSTV